MLEVRALQLGEPPLPVFQSAQASGAIAPPSAPPATTAKQMRGDDGSGCGRSARRDGPDKVARIGVVELEARALVQHVGVNPVRPQERNPLLALRALALQPRQFGGQRDDLLIEFLTRVQP